jgi:hypothetical protein
VPKQDIKPWRDTLDSLLGDQEKYEDLARRSREAAVAYVEGIDRGQYSRLLREVWDKKFRDVEIAN